MSLTVGSLFSGIGGLELGLERAGMTVAWQVEIDPFARRVLAKHWPDVPKYEDVHDVGAHNLEPVDLICGGFPCQPVSVAGKRRAQEDERWLWPEFARIIRELRPRYALMENVPGLLVRGFGDVLGDLAEAGYDAEWCVLGADDVGAPHRRKRVIIVATRAEQRGVVADAGSGRRPNNGLRAGRNEPRACGSDEMAYAKGVPIRPGLRTCEQGGIGGRRPSDSDCPDLPHPSRDGRRQGRAGRSTGVNSRVRNATCALADTEGERLERRTVCRNAQQELPGPWEGGGPIDGQWSVEPDVGRVAHGIPSRVDRLRALGNAVVPQVAHWIGNRIMEAA